MWRFGGPTSVYGASMRPLLSSGLFFTLVSTLIPLLLVSLLFFYWTKTGLFYGMIKRFIINFVCGGYGGFFASSGLDFLLSILEFLFTFWRSVIVIFVPFDCNGINFIFFSLMVLFYLGVIPFKKSRVPVSPLKVFFCFNIWFKF